jgi:hypothetical protein
MELAYSAVGAGLEEMTCLVTIPNPQMKLTFDVKFVAPDKTTVKVTGLPPEAASYAPMLEQRFNGMLSSFFGEMLEGPMSDIEDYNLEMKEGTTNVVVQTKFAADAESERVEITFGENGLPTKIMNQTAQGSAEITPTFAQKGDKYVMTRAKVATPGGMGDATIDWTFEQVGKFWVVSKVVLESMQGAVEITASDIKVKPSGETTTDE